MEDIITNIMGELLIMDTLGIKPNYSALERETGIDRHTIKKWHTEGKVPERKKVVRVSKWDPFKEEITELMKVEHVTKMAVYQYLKNKYKEDIPGSYNGFKSYTLKQGIKTRNGPAVPHVLFETDPGVELQIDWKESLQIVTVNGEIICFNVFTATLSYSRLHVFIYSRNKTTEDFMRCLLAVLNKIGGKTERVKTDNMSAIVSVKSDGKKIHKSVKAFFDDLEMDLKLCEARTPETKGKCETANKFVNWIQPYQGKIKDEMHLIEIIEKVITRQCNLEINQRTMIPPVKLFEKEKEYLHPIGNSILLESYLKTHKRTEVPSTLLVYFEGHQYSVPKEYQGEIVDIYLVGSEVYIYHNKILITVHTITQSRINYNEEHYKDALAARLKTDVEDISEMAEKNLEKLKKMGL